MDLERIVEIVEVDTESDVNHYLKAGYRLINIGFANSNDTGDGWHKYSLGRTEDIEKAPRPPHNGR